jgi:hypothetical protein
VDQGSAPCAMIIYFSVKCNGAGLRLNDDHIAGLLAAVTVRVKSMCQMYSALLRLQERRPRRHHLVVLILLIEHPNEAVEKCISDSAY